MGSALTVAMVSTFPTKRGQVDGGVQAVTSYLVDAMRRLDDVNVQVVTFTREVSTPTVIDDDGLLVHALPMQRFGVTTRHRAERKIFDQVLNDIRPDVVHGQGVLREGYLAVRSAYPSVVTVHGIIREDARYVSR